MPEQVRESGHGTQPMHQVLEPWLAFVIGVGLFVLVLPTAFQVPYLLGAVRLLWTHRA